MVGFVIHDGNTAPPEVAKALASSTNHFAHTPVDEAFQGYDWTV